MPGGITIDSPNGAHSSWWPPGSGEEPVLGLDPGARHDEVDTTRAIAKFA